MSSERLDRLDQPGFDTWLARKLIDDRLLEPERVQQLWLERQAQAGRSTLARTICSRGILDEATVDRLLGESLGGRTLGSGPQGARVPSALGGYRLTRELGSGGMGVVYLGVHQETGAERAIKLMPKGDALRAQRFRREGEAMARVDHPNVVRVHDLGVGERYLYLVMDLAAGGSLEERLDGGPLPFDEARALVRDLARGLAHVHALGILHRDLKPANVLFDEHGTPKLTDFGLARLAWEGSLTESGAMMGTPSFIAPEQIQDAAQVDARADVYGLGAILYAALTGQPPFEGNNLLNVLTAVMRDKPPPPRLLRPEVPAWLEAVCAQALAKDPGERPPSALAFADALAHAPVARTQISWAPWLLALAAVAVATALGYEAKRSTPSATTTMSPGPTATVAPSVAPQVAAVEPWPRDGWNASKWFDAKHAATLKGLKTRLRANPEATLPEFERLAGRGHPESNRSLGMAYTSGAGPPRSVGHGLMYLLRALKNGDRAAASYIGCLFLDRALLGPAERDVGMLGHIGVAAELGFSLDDHALVAALMQVALKSKAPDQFTRGAQLVLQALERIGVRPARQERRSWELIQQRFEPPELVRAERRFWSAYQQTVDRWQRDDHSLAEYCSKLELVARSYSLEQGRAALRAGQTPRAVLALRGSMTLGSQQASVELASVAWRGGLGFGPSPNWMVRWLLQLAEIREWRASRLLYAAFLDPEPYHRVAADRALAGAWLRHWASHGQHDAGWLADQVARAGAPRLVVPKTVPAAWRVIRTRPVRVVER